jgi:single-strand DNA-binding protein
MSETTTEPHNDVHLVGRLTTVPYERELPSGDTVVTWRVTIAREDDDGRRDVIDCTAWTARLQRTVASWAKGDMVEVEGALRRRFWRAPGGALGSAYEVEARRARRVATAVTRPRRSG